jgi:predicted metal-binding protein
MTIDNITTAYQELQLYNDYDGSYSFVYDEATKHSSLYLTTLVFSAMISPMMPFHDNATLNRTLNWILSHQKEDSSFDDNGPCFHYQFCAGEFGMCAKCRKEKCRKEKRRKKYRKSKKSK